MNHSNKTPHRIYKDLGVLNVLDVIHIQLKNGLKGLKKFMVIDMIIQK